MAAEWWAVVMAGVAIVVSAVTAVYASKKAHLIASAEFKASEAIKADFVDVIAALRSLIYKGIATSQDRRYRDVTAELDAVRRFQLSISGFALSVLAGERGSDDGVMAGNWRVLGLQMADLSGVHTERDSSFEVTLACHSLATDIENTLCLLDERDFKFMAAKVKNMMALLASLEETKENDLVLAASSRVALQRREGESDVEAFDRLRKLKAEGVNDPDVDMWLAVEKGDPAVEELRSALDRGADPNISLQKVLEKYPSA